MRPAPPETPRRGAGALACAAAALLAAACSDPPARSWQGYAEGEYLRLAAPYAGSLARLHVARGDEVAAGAPLFELEHAAEDAQLAEARARLAAAQARRANLATGLRSPQVDALRAQVAAARAARDLAARQLGQQQDLAGAGFVSGARIDEARAGLEGASARLADAAAQQRAAAQSLGREAERAAAEAEADAAQAAVAQAEWRLAQKSVHSPAAALVHDTYFAAGEWVPAGAPVLSLLPPGRLRLRFYVPQAALAALRPGGRVTATCDGCPAPIEATVSYVSPQAEYTPPVLYGKETRARLMFLVEARAAPQAAAELKPGQPLDVVPAAP